MHKWSRWIALLVVAALAVIAYMYWPRGYCRSAYDKYDLKLKKCPDGKLRQTVYIRGQDLRRDGEGKVSLSATGLYTIAKSDAWQRVELRKFSTELALIDSAGKETPIATKDGWKSEHGEKSATVTLPRVDDGDYKLRARVKTKVGEESVDLPLALYAPARIHILTDRPLYEPGNEVKFRAMVVRARDLTPIDHRPGKWLVHDPNGVLFLEEKAPAGEWGVVAGTFPLDGQAQTGQWRVTWQSGNDRETVRFRVEPFTLPRFRVEASPDQPYYRPGDSPSLSGSVVYSSGAPVIGAKVDINWRNRGLWPPPTEWLEETLPKEATTDASGNFELKLPVVPGDLIDEATLVAEMAAVDPAGDRVEGQASVLLAQDAVQVQAVTEMGNGLIENANNRVYLRVTRADDQKLGGAKIKITREWAPGDEPILAELDNDSVARVQLDPGPPVNVIIPAMPVRQEGPKPGQLIIPTFSRDMVTQDSIPLADTLAMKPWLTLLEPCGKWVLGSTEISLGLRINPAGAIVSAVSDETPLARCVLDIVRRQRLTPGTIRLYSLGFTVREAELPNLSISSDSARGAVPDPLTELFELAALDARDCLPKGFDDELPWVLTWQLARGQKKPQISWLKITGDIPMPDGADRCISSRIARHELAEPVKTALMGVAHMSIASGDEPKEDAIKPQPTVMKGYELRVAVEIDGKPFGDTRLRMRPGRLPALRVRASSVLAKPGEELEFTIIRGPDYTGDVPEKLEIRHFGDSQEIDLDEKTRTARYKLPDDAEGWYEAAVSGYRALVYVRPQAQLSVGLTPEMPRYAPGATAKLKIQTSIGGQGARAAVGLFGVDDSLGQLASLPGPDELADLRSEVTMSERVFGALDAGALALGRIRGQFAAEATILKVSRIPLPAEIDVVVDAYAETEIDAIAELTDRFYTVLTELHTQTRAWEETAPTDAKMDPRTMARLWEKALDAVKARGQSVEDAFGRRLRLHRLPGDLLALTDPRQVVVVGTRLPEDVENWNQWVQENKP